MLNENQYDNHHVIPLEFNLIMITAITAGVTGGTSSLVAYVMFVILMWGSMWCTGITLRSRLVIGFGSIGTIIVTILDLAYYKSIFYEK